MIFRAFSWIFHIIFFRWRNSLEISSVSPRCHGDQRWSDDPEICVDRQPCCQACESWFRSVSLCANSLSNPINILIYISERMIGILGISIIILSPRLKLDSLILWSQVAWLRGGQTLGRRDYGMGFNGYIITWLVVTGPMEF